LRFESQRHPDRQQRQFKENDLRKAQLTSNPLEDHSLDKFRLFSVELERLTRRSLEHLGLDAKTWIVARTSSRWACATGFTTARWSRRSAGSKKNSRTSLCLSKQQTRAQGGYSYCEATEAFQISYEIPPAQLTPACIAA